VPKHPETKANLAEIEKSEAQLNAGDAMNAGMESAEVLSLSLERVARSAG